MIQAFFDESGIHDAARVCIVAGFVASSSQWERFEALWKSLGPDAKEPGFHAKNFFARDPTGARVSPYKGWTNERANRLLEGLTQCVESTNVHPIVAAAAAFAKYTVDERRHLTGSYDKANKLRITGSPRRPYYLVFQSVIIQTLRRLKRLDWNIHFCFDQQSVLAPYAVKLYQHMRESPENSDWQSRMGVAEFTSRHLAPALQAADLLCYCWYQLILNSKNNISPQLKSVLDTLEGKNYRAEFFNKATMDRLLGRSQVHVAREFRA